MRIELPWPVSFALRRLHGAGHQALIVGGCVRDHLLGGHPSDYDVTTSALPEEVLAAFRGEHLLTVGLKHGTVTLIKRGMAIEITTFRIDGEYEDRRHPSAVIFTPDLYLDVQRRDFTVNALCWSEETGLIDYVEGLSDLEARVVRCVGEPDLRFQEDGLRILRALRFSSVLDFDIAQETAQSVVRNKALLREIAVERMRVELEKLLRGARAEPILLGFRTVFEVFLPALAGLSEDAYLLAARRVALTGQVAEMRLAALFYDLPFEEAVDAVRALRFSNRARALIETLLAGRETNLPGTRARARHLIGELGADEALALIDLKAADAKALCHLVVQRGDCVSLAQLALRGDDLMAAGVGRRRIGRLLAALLELVMDGRLPNERGALLDYAARLKNGDEEDG